MSEGSMRFFLQGDVEEARFCSLAFAVLLLRLNLLQELSRDMQTSLQTKRVEGMV